MTEQQSLAVDFRRQEQDDLTRAYGLEMKMLYPWEGLVAPFEGAWCVLRPGDKSVPHAHHEHEIFIGISGRAAVVTPDRRYDIAAGDIAFLRPQIEHFLCNDTDADFTYYAIWWDRAMSGAFIEQVGEDA